MKENTRSLIGAVVVVGLLTVLAAHPSAVLAESSASATQSTDDPSEIELYEHRTESGATVHTIVLPPENVEVSTSDDVLGVVVIPEQDRICQSIDGKSYQAASAGCMKNESKVDAYLTNAGVERTADGGYTVA